MRLFIAIDPPQGALAELARAIEPLRNGTATDRNVRWAATDSWHLTLAFLGQVEESVLADLSTRLERAARRHPVQRLAIAGAGAFPRPARARVLWAGIRADYRELAALATSVARAASKAGAPPPDEHRRYSAHLTLARCRDQADVTDLVTALAGFAGTEWTATSITLRRSNLSGNPRYEDLGTWPLTGH